MTRLPDFRAACELWCKAALDLLQSKPLPLFLEPDIEITSNGWITKEGTPKASFDRLVLNNLELIIALPMSEAVYAIVAANKELTPAFLSGDIQPPPNNDFLKGHYIRNHLYKFLITYLERAGGFAFSMPIFESIYSQLEEASYPSGAISVVWGFVLSEAKLETASISLGSDTQIRTASDDEKVRRIRAFRGIDDYGTVPEVILQIRTPLVTAAPAFGPALDAGNRVLLALRLLQPEPIRFTSVVFESDNPFVAPNSGTYSITSPTPWFLQTGQYRITQEIADALPRLWSQIMNTPDSTLETPIVRLNDSNLRTKREDKLLDYWIALESLYLPDENVRAMDLGVALAASYYLGQNANDRDRILNDLRASYALRNFLIHGKRGPARAKFIAGIDSMVATTGEYVRETLRKRLAE
jgi:hypothetical protein